MFALEPDGTVRCECPVDGFRWIAGRDLEVTKMDDQVVVSFAYDKEIPLFGPAYLLIKYTGSSASGYN